MALHVPAQISSMMREAKMFNERLGRRWWRKFVAALVRSMESSPMHESPAKQIYFHFRIAFGQSSS
ncbi:hypothetical protein OIU84_020893 [Salix udensis]|uniref:Uncharacterized protein n=1 Tax=Salix udensis TaxID=889485 RepID=A0AAD6KTM9_9ROSI|nr:hypothetical protein OIU84_020893 [Salix udensis]